MIDIETLSTKSNATVLVIGAIKFDRKNIKPLSQLDVFHRRIDKRSCKKLNMDIDPETQKWWEHQSKEAYYDAFENPDRVSLREALEELCVWFGRSRYVWSKGPSFDCVILENAMSDLGIKVPWKFWNQRCVRTIYDLTNIKENDIVGEFENHTAVDDCYKQIQGIKMGLERLNIV